MTMQQQANDMTATRNAYETPPNIEVSGAFREDFAEVLTPDALAFVGRLHQRFDARRRQLLALRHEKQRRWDAGELPDFLPETHHIREGEWRVAPVPSDIQDRRVEITGPVDRKMIINALNSGARVFMADFEDANSPTWANCLEGQLNLRDANLGTLAYDDPRSGKQYRLNEEVAALFVRPRGWHLEEAHLVVDGRPVSASLFDFGLYFFHNAALRQAQGKGVYLYLPKLESHLEARLWNDVFVFAQSELGIPQGTIKATVLLETILAAFEMDEILWELRDHSAGLNCGRWDYIFSIIKKFSKNPHFLMPDRDQVGMTAHCMHSYSLRVIQICHRRGAHAMGGMAAQIPVKGDAAANDEAFEKVRLDKIREAKDGHDGTWVAHPGLVRVALDAFDKYMPDANNIAKLLPDLQVTAADLLAVPQGKITERGVRENINVGILYIYNWLMGNGAAALYYKMEDAATAEISRAQLWQWIHNAAKMDDGRTVTYELYRELLQSELFKIKDYIGETAFANGRVEEAVQIFEKLIIAEEFPEFLTLVAYPFIA
jgi:malate synthase